MNNISTNTAEQATTDTGTQNYMQLAQEAYQTSTTYFDSSIRKQVEAGIRQFQGIHPVGSKYHADSYKSRSRLFRPKTRTTIRKNEAVAAEAFFATRDATTVTADDESNERQKTGATLMQSLLNYRLEKSIPWFMTVMGAYQDAQVAGACVSFQHWVYDEKKKIDKPVIDLLPLENFRFDPGASWVDPVNSSPYTIRLIPMYVKDVKAKMMKNDPKTGAPKWKAMSDTQLLAAADASSDTTRQARERGRTDSTQQGGITSFTIVWVHEVIMEIDGEDMIWYTLGNVGLLSDPVPLADVYFHGIRPYVLGICIIEAHKIYPDGVTGISKDVQAEINEVANQRIDNVKFAMNKRYFAKRGAQVDLRSVTRNVPGSVTMMNDPEKDVIVVNTPDVTSSAYAEQDRLNLDYDDVTGSFSQSSIQSNRKLNETVGGMNLLSVNTNQVSAYQLRTFVETWVQPVLRQMVLLEQEYETDLAVLTKAGRMAGIAADAMEALDSMLMQDLTLTVDIGMGPSNPQEKINNFIRAMSALREILADGLLERYGMDVEEVIKELFGNLGYKDGARFFNTEAEDPRLTAAKATIEELQKALEAKVDPAMVAKQIEKLDAEIGNLGAKAQDTMAASVQKYVQSAFAAMQTGQMISAVPAIAPVGDKVLEFAGATPQGGTDPDFPQPDMPADGLIQNGVKDPRSGIEFMPGGLPPDTSPQTPATAGTGAMQGINTLEADS